MFQPPITVVKTPTFKNDADSLLDEEERLELITTLARNPEAGSLKVIEDAPGSYVKFRLDAQKKKK